jgi:hypothetical protein
MGEPDYPSIDQFLDELPPIEDFLAVDAPASVAEASVVDDQSPIEIEAEPAPEPEPELQVPPVAESKADEWISAGWQSYDFRSLSELANRTPAKAVPAIVIQESKPEPSHDEPAISVTAHEVAEALDGIARRIRSGELVIDNLHGMPPEAAMAAAIAALLRMRG